MRQSEDPPSNKDIELVMDQAEVTREQAILALKAADNDTTDAIMYLLNSNEPSDLNNQPADETAVPAG